MGERVGVPAYPDQPRTPVHSKASEQVLKIARELKCSVCERFKRPRPSRAGAPPREVGLNEVVGVDTIQMRASFSQKPKYCLNICDYASHFQLVVPLADHTAQGARQGYRTWIRLFGPPRRLLCDLGREFQKEFEDSAEADGTEILPSSLETPEQRGFVERNGQLFKDMAYKTMEQVNCNNWTTWHECIDITCHTKNRLLSRGGFSPAQRVFGYQQRIPGGLMSDGAGDLAVQSRAAAGDLGVNQAMEIHKAASQSFHEIDCQQAIRAAATHGPRPHCDYQPGQAVYFWRRGTDPTRKAANAFWHGPARVVAAQLPTTVWISYNHHLVKAAPEKLRPASEEENLSISGWLDGIGHAKKQFETADIKGMIDLFKEEEKPPVDLDDAQDYWTRQGVYVIRVHERPRNHVFYPTDAEDDAPVPLEDLENWMRIEMIDKKGKIQQIETTWKGPKDEENPLRNESWTGKTWFRLKELDFSTLPRREEVPPPDRRVRQKTQHLVPDLEEYTPTQIGEEPENQAETQHPEEATGNSLRA